MSDFPALNGNKLVKTLNRMGFNTIRIKGSHHYLKHEDGRCTVIPVHRSEIIGKGLFSKILRDCDVDKDELRKHL